MIDDAKKRAFLASSIILSSIIATSAAHASPGAWNQPEGKGQLIATASYLRTEERFDTQGRRAAQPAYTQYELNPYVEYGLTREWTVGANLFLQRAATSANSSFGLGDSEFFIRRQLWRTDTYAFSLQPLLKLPSPAPGKTPALGSRTPDIGLSTLSGVNFRAFGRNHYAELESGYRHRFGAAGDQMRLNATLGLSITDTLTLMPQMFQTWRAQKAIAPVFTQSPRDDYALSRAQISALYTLNETTRLQAGAFQHIAGRNAGAGGGAFLAVWREF